MIYIISLRTKLQQRLLGDLIYIYIYIYIYPHAHLVFCLYGNFGIIPPHFPEVLPNPAAYRAPLYKQVCSDGDTGVIRFQSNDWLCLANIRVCLSTYVSLRGSDDYCSIGRLYITETSGKTFVQATSAVGLTPLCFTQLSCRHQLLTSDSWL